MRPLRVIVLVGLAAALMRCPFLVGGDLPAEADSGVDCTCGTGDAGVAFVSPPQPATNLSATIVTCSDGGSGTSIKLQWDAADAGTQTAFWVLRHASCVYAVPFAVVGRVGAQELTYVDSDAQLSVDFNQSQHFRYDYLVLAVNDGGTALPSNDVNIFLNPTSCATQKTSQSCADACN